MNINKIKGIKFEVKHVISAILLFSLAVNAYLFLEIVKNTSNDASTKCYLSTKLNILSAEADGVTVSKSEKDLINECLETTNDFYPWYL